MWLISEGILHKRIQFIWATLYTYMKKVKTHISSVSTISGHDQNLTSSHNSSDPRIRTVSAYIDQEDETKS